MSKAADSQPYSGSTLRAAQLRELTGLSDRQLHEWDKRGALPHRREAGGHRRVSLWEGIALKITAAIRDRYGTPLTRLTPVLHWLIGNERSKHWATLFVSDSDFVPSTQAEADFWEELLAFAAAPPPGLAVFDELPDLITRTIAFKSPRMTRDVKGMVGALVPLYWALAEMLTKFPTYLVTNLSSHFFVAEPWLVDHVRAGILPSDPIILRVDEHINAVLGAVGARTLPVEHRAQDIEPVAGASLEEKERRILEILRDGDFESITISPKRNGYRIEITRELSDVQAKDIESLIRDHQYQSVLVKTRHGKVIRLTQTISTMTPDSEDGKIPHRSGPNRSRDA